MKRKVLFLQGKGLGLDHWVSFVLCRVGQCLLLASGKPSCSFWMVAFVEESNSFEELVILLRLPIVQMTLTINRRANVLVSVQRRLRMQVRLVLS